MKKLDPESPLLGAHFSIAGGLHNAIESAARYGCHALQIFTKNATTWKERQLSEQEVELFRQKADHAGITAICSHGSYLLNLASPEKEKRAQSKKALTMELKRCASLGIPYVVIHPGAHMESGEKKGIQRIATSVKSIFKALPENPCRLLLETTAGQGTTLGNTFEQLASLLERIGCRARTGICFDTCHVFASGYDLRTPTAYEKTMHHFDTVVGLNRIYGMHLNDAKMGLGSKKDRHEHIGKGTIGEDAFRFIMNDTRLVSVPKIIETPKKDGKKDGDRRNLNLLRSLVVRDPA